MNAPLPNLPSPCTGICKMEESSGLCLGCGRSGAEIAAWSAADDGHRRAIWSRLPERFARLGIAVTRLPWSSRQITDFVGQTLRQRSGTWVFGCYGATAEFMLDGDEAASLSITDDQAVAVSARAALRLHLGEHVRALQLRDDRVADGYRAVFLCVLKARANLPMAPGLTALGPDAGAIRPDDRGATLYDLGLGRPELRFCIRTGETELIDALRDADGLPLAPMLSAVGGKLLKHSPVRVVESPLGRAEISGPIPLPGSKSPDGPHTHLLPNHLATGRSLQPGIDLPPVYALGATFYPRAAYGEECNPDSCA